MQRLLHLLLALAVLGLAFAWAWWFYATEEKAPKRPLDRPPAVVEVLELKPRDEEVLLESRGWVRPRTETSLIPEVSGQILEISPALRSGGFFEKGDVLLRIDPRDYETEQVVAQAELARAESVLAEEKARSEQAREDWSRLGDGTPPTPLALREPQLAEAQANVESALARTEKAARDLERTTIVAPYAGRVLEKRADVGQYVSPGAPLAQIYAVDLVEVRLPLTNPQLAHIDLPEIYRGQGDGQVDGPRVTLEADVAGRVARWEGKVVRVEGAIDEASRQLYVVAQVEDPYRQRGDQPPLKVGLFVEARIHGRVLSGVYKVPRKAVRETNVVYVLDRARFEPYAPPVLGRPGGPPKAAPPAGAGSGAVGAGPMQKTVLQRRETVIAWGDQDHVYVSGGLSEGELVCLTPLPFATEGTPVATVWPPGEPPEPPPAPNAISARNP